MNDFTPEQLSYLKWIRDTMPRFYADNVQPFLSDAGLGNIGVVNQFLRNAGMGNVGDDSTFSNILNSITDALPKLGQTYAEYATAQAALNQRTQQIVATTRAQSTNYIPYLAIGGAALLAIVLLSRR